MKRYIAIICKDADSAFGVHFPDLPGCISAGDNQEKAIDNAGVALRFWAEDVEKLPEPSAMAELLQRTDVRGDLSDGGFAILVPLIAAGRRQRLNIMLEPDVIAATDIAARSAGVSRSAYIERALEGEIARELGAVRHQPQVASHRSKSTSAVRATQTATKRTRPTKSLTRSER